MMGNGAGAPGDLFAGRVDEQARLGKVLSASAKGVPAPVLVQGEAGVGKTRLVREVTEQ
ncbi:MAG: ATP-binding protein [Actinomycetota bacterium]